MRNRIIGGIGILWGAGMLISFLIRSGSGEGGAYGAGQTMGLLFGVVMFGAGVYYVVKGGSSK